MARNSFDIILCQVEYSDGATSILTICRTLKRPMSHPQMIPRNRATVCVFQKRTVQCISVSKCWFRCLLVFSCLGLYIPAQQYVLILNSEQSFVVQMVANLRCQLWCVIKPFGTESEGASLSRKHRGFNESGHSL